MKLGDIYEKAVRRGIELDPRGKEEVNSELKKKKSDFEDLKEKERRDFDMESLVNPYSDTRILYGSPDRDVEKVLLGIDIEVGEVLLADRLRERGIQIDLMIAHHPEGRAMAGLYEVMGMQSDILMKHGVPINVAEDIMEGRIKEVERKILPINHTRAVDAARLLDLPFMCLHTPADNVVAAYLQQLLDERRPDSISDIIEILRELPEYEEAAREKAALKVIVGSEKRKVGRIFVDMTGGTGGSKKAFENLSRAGVGTVVGMHLSEDHRKEAEKHHINVVIAGHIASDNLGLNLLLDSILDGVDVIPCSGFRRIERKH
ncbi:MAG: NGG1p interacting factor NIF3 [Thermodesulfobacteriota bacterium]